MFSWRRAVAQSLHLLRHNKCAFFVGVLIGAFLAVVLFCVQQLEHPRLFQSGSAFLLPSGLSYLQAEYDQAYERWVWGKWPGARIEAVDPDVGRYANMSGVEAPRRPMTEASLLWNLVPVICVVLVSDAAWAVAVRDTWGRHCNQLQLFSHLFANDTLHISKLNASSQFGLLCRSFHAVLGVQPADSRFWVIVATQNSYVLVENFRYFVAPKSQSAGPYYLGHAMRFWNTIYNWADAGYGLDSDALRLLLSLKFPTEESCDSGGRFWKNGDWYLGKHLSELGIQPEDTRDHAGRSRFNGHGLNRLLFPGGVSAFDSYRKNSVYPPPDGPQCCSNFAITFSGVVSKSKMYQLEYLHYHLRPFYAGGQRGNRPAPSNGSAAPPPALTWDEALKEEALAKRFDHLMTTPKDLEQMIQQVLAPSSH